MNKKIYTLLVLTIALGTANAQEETKIVSSYNPYSLFSPNFYPANNSTTRSATGEPNIGYWQNKADYQINATLNDITNQICVF